MNQQPLRIKSDEQAIVAELEAIGVQMIRGRECRCPFHDDHTPSAGVYLADDGWRFKCHGCKLNLDVIGIRARRTKRPEDDLMREERRRESGADPYPVQLAKRQTSPPPKPAKPPTVYSSIEGMAASINAWARREFGGQVAAQYEYRNPSTGNLDAITFRIEPGKDGKRKTFTQGHQTPAGFIARGPAEPWPLYARDVIAGSDWVVVVEGEKCAEYLRRLGIPATTTLMGGDAHKATKTDWAPLAGKTLYLWPDNDPPNKATGERCGIAFMRAAARELEKQTPQPRVLWVDPDRLGLADKADVVDFGEQFADLDDASKANEIMAALETAEPTGAAADVMARMRDQITGRYAAVPWPWQVLTNFTHSLLPGSITFIGGDPGCGKSLALIQALAWWTHKGYAADVLELEEDRTFHLLRAMAQHCRTVGLLDPEWCKQNPREAEGLTQQAQDFIHRLGAHVFDRSTFGDRRTCYTLADVANWIEARAQAGSRIVGVDPVTHVHYGDRQWLEDGAFMDRVGTIATQYEISIVLATHPTKAKGTGSLSDMAGGAAFQRFSQCVLWMARHNPPAQLAVRTAFGTTTEEADRVLQIRKARNGIGGGAHLAYTFNRDSLTLHELGVVQKNEG